MKNIKLLQLWDSLRSGYWFLPALMAVGAITLAFFTLALDRSGQSDPVAQYAWSYAGGPEGARTLLSTVAGSTIAIAGTVFSLTIVALQLASAQFGPRMLRNFIQDTGNQIVLGTFVATFIYCLLVLRTVRGTDANIFVPQISVTVAIVLTLASSGVLIYFIHHVSTSIQAWHVIKGVSSDLDNAIDSLFPKNIGQGIPKQKQRWVEEIPVNFDDASAPIPAMDSGYLQAVDDECLMKIARSKDLLLRLTHHPGNFVVQASELVQVYPGERVNESLIRQINDAFILGSERTENQDVDFPIKQLVEIAIRAISPAINDPFTAIRCIDRLSVALCRLAKTDFPSPYRYDQDNNLRVIADPVTFAELTDAAFNQIRQYGRSDVTVTIRLLEAITRIARHTRNSKDRATLLRHADMIERGSRQGVSEECDRSCIEERYQAAVKALEQ